MSRKYNLTDDQLLQIARLCYQEQGSVAGAAAEASLMANLYEAREAKYKSLYDYVRNSGWFSRSAYWMDHGSAPDAVVQAVRKVLIDGQRTLPEYIDEHDCFSDIQSATNNGREIKKADRSAYIPDVTRIKNRFGSSYTFFTFPDKNSDPFGYTKKTGGDKVSYSIDKLIQTAEAEDGYLEKKSNKQLDDKTANAGSNNYTKYGRDLVKWLPETGDTFGINYQWCQQFIVWIFIQAFGKEAALKLLGGWSARTLYAAEYFKKRGQWFTSNPKRGDVIYFYVSGDIHHVGLVTGADNKKVYTIEGNTSGASEVINNGGGVCKKSYSLSNDRIAGYGRPAYGEQKEDKWKVMDNRQFIINMYVSELYREPKEEEINSWMSAINNGMPYNTVLEGFRNAPEGKKAWIAMMYKTLLDRDPDQDGLEAWIKYMGGGHSRMDVLRGFLASKEYKEYHKNDHPAVK